ncbi:MAG: hypothetical protein JXB04_00135 [Kiritimatiellae bacterium]|nr:hypothetical protein [Kiritimatiellia bacterium]
MKTTLAAVIGFVFAAGLIPLACGQAAPAEPEALAAPASAVLPPEELPLSPAAEPDIEAREEELMQGLLEDVAVEDDELAELPEALPVELPAELPAEEVMLGVESELIELDVEKELSGGIDVEPSERQKDLITISLDDVPLQDVVRMFTRISGANIVAGTNLQGNVTVSLQDVEWEPALRVILDSVDMAMVEKTPGIYSIMSKSALLAEPVTVETLFLNFTTVSNVLPIVRRMLVSSNSSVSAFSSANAMVIQETATHLKNIKETVSKLDVPRPQVFIEAKFVELNDEAIKDIGINWQSLQGYTVGLNAPSYAWARGRLKEEGTAESRTRSEVETSTRRLTDSDTITRTDLDSESDTESDSIVDSFTLVNGVPSFLFEDVFTDDEDAIESSSRSRVRLDEDFDQTLLTRIRSDSRDVTDSVLTTTEELLSAVLSAEDFQLTLSALKQNAGVDVVSNPRLIVASGETANIHVGLKEPNVEAKPQGDSGNVYVYGLGSPEFFEVGVRLKVTPVVNTAERITVKIDPELSRLLAPVTVGAGELTFPRIQTRTISTEFNLESGRTVAIGGLTQTSDEEQVSKVPVLGDIPILGRYLFRHTHTQRVQDEVIIFVTVGLAGAEVLTEVAGVPSGGRLIHKHLAKEALQR